MSRPVMGQLYLYQSPGKRVPPCTNQTHDTTSNLGTEKCMSRFYCSVGPAPSVLRFLVADGLILTQLGPLFARAL